MADLLTHGEPVASMQAFRRAWRRVQLETCGYAPPASHEQAPLAAESAAHQQRWSPYSYEGGTIAAVAGDDFVVIAADTRLSADPSPIYTRHGDKITQLNDYCYLAATVFEGDVLQLRRVLRARIDKYRFDYNAEMSVDLLGSMLARNLYYRRFFPYLTGATLAGIDAHGKGAVYTYDPVGCVERSQYTVEGNGQAILEPFLDAQVGGATTDKTAAPPPALTAARAQSLLRDAFRSTAERDTTTGDRLAVVVLRADGEGAVKCERTVLKLRED